MEQLINTYVDFCYIWNKELFICPFKTIDEIKIPEEFCSRDLDLDSDLRYLLPRRQGPGLCATGLVSYLVTLHNELVNAVDRHTREDSRYFFKAGYVAFLIELYQVSSYLNFKQRDRWVKWASFRGVSIKNPFFHLGAWHRYPERHNDAIDTLYIVNIIQFSFVLNKNFLHQNSFLHSRPTWAKTCGEI